MERLTKAAQLQQLTRGDLVAWAGATIVQRGQSYQRSGHVQHLALTPDGALLAWVYGTERYATMVDYDDNPVAVCTCPYEDVCKHAVAVLLEYQVAAAQHRALPTTSAADPRLVLLADAGEDWDPNDDPDQRPDGRWSGGIGPTVIPAGDPAVSALRLFLEDQSKDALIDMLLDIAQRFPEAQSFMQTQRSVETGNVDEVLRETSALIAAAAAEDDWYDEWSGEPDLPDFSAIRDRLDTLLRHGHADEVVEFGEQLLDAGNRMVEFIHDEGEAMGEVAACLDVVFAAMSQTSLPPAEQMLRVIDLELQDQYDMTAGAQVFWEQPHDPATWSAVAEALLQRLAREPVASVDFSRSYKRERLSEYAIRALEAAGRHDEIIPLAEQEAERNESYVRLVQLLVAAGRTTEAEQWILKGIRALDSGKPGLASQLRGIQRDLWEQAGDWPRIADLRADEFFHQPSVSGLKALRAAAERAGVWQAVRAAALHYLETGELPAAASWPLPPTGLPPMPQRWQPSFPMRSMLIEWAIEEQHPDEVLRWYDQPAQGREAWAAINHDRVAEAVVNAYPERAAEIWKSMAEAQIAQTNTRAYDEAAVFLEKLGQLRKRQGRMNDWRNYIADLRAANKRKRRLMETLDGLEAELT